MLPNTELTQPEFLYWDFQPAENWQPSWEPLWAIQSLKAQPVMPNYRQHRYMPWLTSTVRFLLPIKKPAKVMIVKRSLPEPIGLGIRKKTASPCGKRLHPSTMPAPILLPTCLSTAAL